MVVSTVVQPVLVKGATMAVGIWASPVLGRAKDGWPAQCFSYDEGIPKTQLLSNDRADITTSAKATITTQCSP
jgi:hypothetical protein